MSIPYQYAMRRRMMGGGGLPPIGITLEAATWEEINAVGAAGKAPVYWQPGDVKSITLPYAVLGSTSIAIEILGFDYDDLADGSGKAAISIGMVDCFATTQQMNSSNTNSGGWRSCGLRTTCTNTILPAFVSAIGANIIKPVNKRTSVGSRSTSINTTTDSVWLLSEYEIFGEITCSVVGEKPNDRSTCYTAFTDAESRIKKNASTTYYGWFNRSPSGSYNERFCFVNPSGTAGDNYAGNTRGVAVGFCV